MKYLGVDYGKSKIGLALSEGTMASPLNVIFISSLDDALNKIDSIIKNEKIDKVVVGIPESGEARKIAKVFTQRLKMLYGDIHIIEADETLTSQTAKILMVNLGIGKKKREEEDAYSAALILQNYLDNE